MTDTTTNQTERGTDTAEEAQQQSQGTLEHLDPQTLALEINVRDDVALDADFVASVKEHGVMNPIVAVRGADGVVRVRNGQRRTLAARESGLATIPVYVRHVTDGDEKAQVVERVAEQIVENDQRQAPTDAQRVRGIQQLLDAGVPVTKVAKLSISRDTVKSAATTAGSAAAMEALNAGQLSLAEAAALTEFDDDPDAVARLLEVAGTGRFEHKVAEIRNQRESDKAYAQAAEQFAAQGYTVLDEYPRYGDTSRVELRYLRTPDGGAATDEAITDPAHWAIYLSEDTAYADTETGELIDGDDIDWHCRFNGSGEPDEGMRHPNSVTERVVFEPDWFCIDYAAAGLELCDILAKRAQAIARENAGGAGNNDDHDDEARAAAQAEAERRERRKVIALKLGDAAQQVRRQFITEKLLTRRTSPKGAAIFVAHCLTRDVRLVEEYRGGEIAAEMLGAADLQAVHQLVGELAASGDGRARVITLALVLGALEARAPKDAWRGTGGYGRYVGPAELLNFLADNGYQLSDVERVMVGERTPDEVFADISQKAQPDDDSE